MSSREGAGDEFKAVLVNLKFMRWKTCQAIAANPIGLLRFSNEFREYSKLS
jgi:hypothetical protein